MGGMSYVPLAHDSSVILGEWALVLHCEYIWRFVHMTKFNQCIPFLNLSKKGAEEVIKAMEYFILC